MPPAVLFCDPPALCPHPVALYAAAPPPPPPPPRLDMGTSDELALDVLINALSNFSREQLGIRQLVVGGQNEDWPVPQVQWECGGSSGGL